MPITRSATNRSGQPIASSTPYNESTSFRPQGRQSIREPKQPSEMPSDVSDSNSSDSDEGSSKDDAHSTPQSNSLGQNVTQNSNLAPEPERQASLIERLSCLFKSTIAHKSCIACIIVGLIGIIICVLYDPFNRTVPVPFGIESVQHRFPLQSQELWSAFKSGINEVKEYDKPSVFLFLYKDESQQTVNKLLPELSKCSNCIIKDDCSVNPVVLTNKVLSSERAISDYGNLIHDYKNQLQNQGVMIVNNLEQITGTVAQMFHSMCDEFSPLVNKAVFLFTVKVEDFPDSPKSDMRLVENILHNKWSDLNDDIFYPLITRITNIVLRVQPEK